MSPRLCAALLCAALALAACGPDVAERRADPPATDPMPEPLRDLEPFEDAATFKWGYRDARTGEVVLEPAYDMAGAFTEGGIAHAALPGVGWRVIDQDGTVLLEPFVVDNFPDEFVDGLARFEQDGRIGFYDASGVVAIEARYDFAEGFEDGRARVCMGCTRVPDGDYERIEGGQWGAIDREGNLVEPLQ